MADEKEKNGRKTNATEDSKSGFFSHAFWMGFLSTGFYLVLLEFMPLLIVIVIAFYMGFGKYAFQNALKKRKSSMESIAVTFMQCLKLFAMQIVWPLSVKIISSDE